jgi:hypothetical protein
MSIDTPPSVIDPTTPYGLVLGTYQLEALLPSLCASAAKSILFMFNRFITTAATLAPMPALLAELFQTGTCGSGLTISYNVAVLLFGGFAPQIVT